MENEIVDLLFLKGPDALMASSINVGNTFQCEIENVGVHSLRQSAFVGPSETRSRKSAALYD